MPITPSLRSTTIDKTIQVSLEHVMIQGTSSCMSLAPTSHYAVIAAKKGLYIVDLEQPTQPHYPFLRHVSKWEVADVQWNPHMGRQEWIASTSNQNVLIWNVDDSIKYPLAQLAVMQDHLSERSDTLKVTSDASSSKCVQSILHGHSRAVSDINWSLFQPEWIATCSYDSYVHVWDLKASTTKPVTSMSAWTAGASQVKWNKKNEWLLASSHDSDLRIWDIRKGTIPLAVMTAHTHKIYGIDWSWNQENFILTCGQDKSVKFWDVNQPRVCQGMLMTASPVWRARFTPFGEGVVTMPQRSEHHVALWNYTENTTTPVYTFAGHTDVPREFVWRSEETPSSTKYQLLTWSKDQHLRFWPASEDMLKSVGYTGKKAVLPMISPKPLHTPKKYAMLRDGQHALQSPDPTTSPLEAVRFAMKTPPPTDPDAPLASRWIPSKDLTLQSHSHETNQNEGVEGWWNARHEPLLPWQEDVLWMSREYPCFQIEKMNTPQQTAFISLVKPTESHPNAFIRLELYFPNNYPMEPPQFDIPKNTMLSMTQRSILVKRLNALALEPRAEGVNILEHCLDYWLTSHSVDGVDAGIKNVFLKRDDSEQGIQEGIQEGFASATSLVMHEAYDPLEGDMDSISSSSSTDSVQVKRVLVANDKYTPEGLSKKTKFVAGGYHSVPFPRLCGATFSRTGQLVYFFSPMPHPCDTKFIDQHVFYGKYYSMQPKMVREYAQYKQFLEQREHRLEYAAQVAAQQAATVLDRKPLKKTARLLTHKRVTFDSWLEDEEDSEEESPLTGAIPSVFWRPSADETLNVPQMSSNFLQKLYSHRQPSPTTPSTQLAILIPEPTSDTPPIVSATPSELTRQVSLVQEQVSHSFKHPLQKIVEAEKSRPSIVLGTPPWRTATSMVSETPMESFSAPSSFKIATPPILVTTPLLEQRSDSHRPLSESNDGYGAVVHVKCVQNLLPVSLDLCQEYGFFTKSPLEQCRWNEHVAKERGLTAVAQVWGLLILLMDVQPPKDTLSTRRGHIPVLPGRYKRRVPESGTAGVSTLRSMLQWCEQRGDIQTIALVGILLYQLYYQYAQSHGNTLPRVSRTISHVPPVSHPPLLLDMAWIPYIDRCIQEYACFIATPETMIMVTWLHKCLWNSMSHETYDVTVRHCPICRRLVCQSMITQCLECGAYGHLTCFQCSCTK